MKQITIRMEDNLHEFLRRYSYENKISINKIIVELINKKQKEESVPPTK